MSSNRKSLRIPILGLVFSICLAGLAFAEPQEVGQIEHLTRPNSSMTMFVQEPRMMRAKGFDYDHEVLIALPASYKAYPEKRYPVLWVTDGELHFHMVIGALNILTFSGELPEMIVVAVGSPSELGMAGHLRRLSDFSPPGEGYQRSGEAGRIQLEHIKFPEFEHRGAEFLSFLIDDLRPRLSREFRMLDGNHALFGHSAGGLFAGYALFARPEAFSKYIIGSPYLYGVQGAVFVHEKEYADSNDDLDVEIFLGLGDEEVSGRFDLADAGLASSTALLAERLKSRRYPSLQITSRIYTGEDHGTVIPRIVMEAIPALWGDENP